MAYKPQILSTVDGGTGASNAAATAGKILRSDGTNYVPTTATFPTTAGSSGNVLTSDGTNWSSAAPSSSGALVLIQSQAASNSASIIFTTGLTYNNYLLLINNYLPATNATNLIMTISINGGSTYISTGYNGGDFTGLPNGSGIVGGNSGGTASFLIFNTCDNTISASTRLNFFDFTTAVAACPPKIEGSSTVSVSGNAFLELCLGMNTTASGSAVNGIKFASSSGNITTGTFKLYGIT